MLCDPLSTELLVSTTSNATERGDASCRAHANRYPKCGITSLVRPESTHKNSLLPGVNRLQADLSDCDVLAGEISRSAAVIYSAGYVRGRRLEDFRAANISGVRSMVNAINKAGATVPLLLISSMAASRPHVSVYANSKYLGEQEVR